MNLVDLACRFRVRPFALFSLAGLVGTLIIGGGSLWASQRAGEAEAMADVGALTELVAKTVVGPEPLNGTIVYSDEPRLIGEQYELGNHETWSLGARWLTRSGCRRDGL